MTNTLGIIRALLIYGLCLPLAVYLGYLLAMPMDRVSLTILTVAIFLPLVPMLLRWHHVLLIASWNMSVVLFFIRGSPHLWIMVTALSLCLTLLQHILKRNVEFSQVPSVSIPLIVLALVVIITAGLTGGIGLRALGGESYGGRRYVVILAAIAGYFAITSHRVPPGRAVAYVGLYFFGALTMIIGSLAPWMPAGLRYVYALIPVEGVLGWTGGELGENIRLGGVTVAAAATGSFILARHGIQGLLALGERWRFLPLQFKGGFGFTQPWRLLFFLATVWIGLLGGYRSTPITLVMLLFFLFWFEGLFRTRLLPAVALLAVLVVAVSLPFVQRMPLMVQRSLSFLPIEIKPEARLDAQHSSEWRIKMWEEAWPSVPRYLLLGKGYSISARDYDSAQQATDFNASESGESASLAADYHNGPLSLIIPLGAAGALAFLWFLGASFRLLLHNYRYGDPALRQLNTFLLAYFLTKTIFFFLVFGSFQTDLPMFTGMVALSASLNGGLRQPAKAPAKPNPAYQPFRLPKTVRA